MNFDVLSFIFGKLNCGSNFNDVVSYLLGKAVSAVWKTITNIPIASFTAVSATLRELIVDVTPLQSGSGDPSPTNVRPISGWTGAKIACAAKNLIDASNAALYDVDGQGLMRNATQPFFLAPGTYTISQSGDTEFKFVNVTDNYSSSGAIKSTTPRTITIIKPSVCVVRSTSAITNTTQFINNNLQVELGESATAYESYAGTTYPVSWQTEAGTVYGGTLTWLGENQWKISNDVRVYNLADLDWNYVSNVANPYFRVGGQSGMVYADSAVHLCNCYKYEAIGGASTMAANSDNNIIGIHANGNQIYVRDTRYTDKASLVTFLASVSAKFIIKVSTATEYTVTVPDSDPTTLHGDNNIFADCGNINTITYRER